MDKFTNIKLNDEIYSIVFGLGKVVFVLEESLRLNGYYIFEVEYENGKRVHYTEGGKASWCKDINKCTRTIYYKSQVDFDDIDTATTKKFLSKYKINELRNTDSLEMMSPAGAWIDASLMPDSMFDNAIKNGEYHLFREIKH